MDIEKTDNEVYETVYFNNILFPLAYNHRTM